MYNTHAAIERTFQEKSGRVLATLIGALGDFTLAEHARAGVHQMPPY